MDNIGTGYIPYARRAEQSAAGKATRLGKNFPMPCYGAFDLSAKTWHLSMFYLYLSIICLFNKRPRLLGICNS
jgi:hypothetical protein